MRDSDRDAACLGKRLRDGLSGRKQRRERDAARVALVMRDAERSVVVERERLREREPLGASLALVRGNAFGDFSRVGLGRRKRHAERECAERQRRADRDDEHERRCIRKGRCKRVCDELVSAFSLTRRLGDRLRQRERHALAYALGECRPLAPNGLCYDPCDRFGRRDRARVSFDD
jgi:hypothetical protein